jgi:hypothetical protein
MLARRFTIVCLVLTIFGMGLASLVAQTGRLARSWEAGASARCVFLQGGRCLPPQRN